MKDIIFDKISPNEALIILRQISKTDKNLKDKKEKEDTNG